MEKPEEVNVISILLVEDSLLGSQWVSSCLNNLKGFPSSLTVCKTIKEAEDQLSKATFQSIIIDLSLEGWQGIEAFEEIHKKAVNTAIIVLAESEDEELGIEAVKNGAQDFLIKGQIEPNELIHSINYGIERHKLLAKLSEKTIELEQKTLDLQREKQKLALANKIARIGSWEWDLESDKVTWSDELFKLHDLEPGRGPFNFRELLSYIHPDDRENVWNVITKSTQSLKPVSFYYRIIGKDGSIRTFYSVGELVANEEGKPIKVVGIRQDVTESKQEEEMQKLAMVATKSYNSVVIADKSGVIEWVNDGFTKLTGYTLDEVKGTHSEILRRGAKTGISQDTEAYLTVTKKKDPVMYESKNFSKSGTEYWTITTLTPVLDLNGKVKRIIAIDANITDRKQMEEDLKKANQVADELLEKANKTLADLKVVNKEMEETMQVKEQFLANMSHEIRTPMNAIVGFINILQKTALTPEQQRYISTIKTSSGNLLEIVNDILDFSKLRSGKVTFENIEFSLVEKIKAISSLHLLKLNEKNIKLTTEIDPNIPEFLFGDPTRLGQILNNLIGNAIKFTEQGEIKISTGVAKKEEKNIFIKFSVSDTGIGIDKDKLGSIFDYFTQASSETTRKYGGTGLGLSIVKQLVEQQGGTIHVDSTLKKGAIFTVHLTFRIGSGDEYRARNKQKIVEHPLSAEGLSVLLVEDNELNRMLAEKILLDWNWKVETAENAFVALNKIEHSNYDVVLMDIQLPGMDGYEATRKIRNELQPDKRNIPVIAMTAHALAGEQEKCMKAGMDGYISKPFEPENLYKKIVSILNLNGNHIAKENNMASPVTQTNPMKHSDLTYLNGLANGKTDFVIQMLSIFIEQTPTVLEKLNEAITNKDWATVRTIVHKMKPSITFTGLKEIEQDVPAMEEYAESGSHLELIPSLYEKMKKVCTEAILELKEEIEKLKEE